MSEERKRRIRERLKAAGEVAKVTPESFSSHNENVPEVFVIRHDEKAFRLHLRDPRTVKSKLFISALYHSIPSIYRTQLVEFECWTISFHVGYVVQELVVQHFGVDLSHELDSLEAIYERAHARAMREMYKELRSAYERGKADGLNQARDMYRREPFRHWGPQSQPMSATCFDKLPKDVLSKVRRTTLGALHPDVGGDAELFKEMGLFFDRLEGKTRR